MDLKSALDVGLQVAILGTAGASLFYAVDLLIDSNRMMKQEYERELREDLIESEKQYWDSFICS
ncbi:MAG: hypothetical protein Q7S06_03515 [Nanoarchaeota archaeon]|nr:hypothetical protein [Nanoarchaeota archaeon]